MRHLKIFLLSILISSNLYPYINIFDKKIEKDNLFFWRSHYNIPLYSSILITTLALYEGSNSRLGKTAWKSLDAGVISAIFTISFKNMTKRYRPIWNDNPNLWRVMEDEEGSFPSQHVAGLTALITPFIMEYKKDYPLVHLLWALPIHQMIGRVKAQAHWQTDVLAGFGVGLISGLTAYYNDTPFILGITPKSISIGFKHKF